MEEGARKKGEEKEERRAKRRKEGEDTVMHTPGTK